MKQYDDTSAGPSRRSVDPEEGRPMLKKLFILLLLGGAAAAVAKKLQAGSDPSGGWQSSYDPAPAPAAPAAPAPSASVEDPAADLPVEAPSDVEPAATDVEPVETAPLDDTAETTAVPGEVPPPPPVDIPPARTEVDPLTDPLPELDGQPDGAPRPRAARGSG